MEKYLYKSIQNKALYFGSVDYNSNSQVMSTVMKKNIKIHINPDTRLMIYVLQNDIT